MKVLSGGQLGDLELLRKALTRQFLEESVAPEVEAEIQRLIAVSEASNEAAHARLRVQAIASHKAHAIAAQAEARRATEAAIAAEAHLATLTTEPGPAAKP